MTIYISQVGKPTFFATRFFSIAWSWIRFLTRLFRFVIGVISIVDNFDSLVWVQFGGDSRFVKYYFRDPNEIVFLGKNVPNVISALTILLYHELITLFPVMKFMKVRSWKVRFFFKHSRYWAYFETNDKENTIKGHLGSFKAK